MKDTVSRGGTGIVSRLRLVSMAVITLTLVGALIGGTSLVELKGLQTETVDRHVPMLVGSSELQASFAEIYLLADRVRRVDAYAEMIELDGQAETLFRRIETVVGRMRALQVGDSALESLSDAIAGAERELRETLVVGRRVVVRKRGLEEDGRAVDELHERLRTLMEPAHTEIVHTLRRTLDRVATEGRLGASESATLDRLLYFQNSLTTISGGVDSVVKLASALARLSAEAGGAELEVQRLRFELRGLSSVLLRLEEGELRTEIAAPLAELHQLFLRDNGLIDHAEQLAADIEAMGEAQIRLLDAFSTVSTLVNDSVAEIEAAAAGTATELAETTDRTLWIPAVTTALVTIVLLLTGYVVLERQISRRVKLLATEVLRIACGNDEAPVVIGGNDEIGDIARSLVVFRENARELRRSNEELEKFAYAAAHDMRSPLRAIESLATWTLEDAGDALTEDCRDNLETLLQRAQRLSNLQNDLLGYAQVGEIDGSLADVDVSRLVDEIRPFVDPDGRFEISVDGAPGPLCTHLVPLRQILMNLLGNAVKHHDRGTGVIVVTLREERSRLHVEVRDDGAGIEPRFHDKIFGLFATLQSKDVVEGSGLGLSMVRKLVERYDGRITVVSDPARERGTTFAFDLPARPPEAMLDRAA